MENNWAYAVCTLWKRPTCANTVKDEALMNETVMTAQWAQNSLFFSPAEPGGGGGAGRREQAVAHMPQTHCSYQDWVSFGINMYLLGALKTIPRAFKFLKKLIFISCTYFPGQWVVGPPHAAIPYVESLGIILFHKADYQLLLKHFLLLAQGPSHI